MKRAFSLVELLVVLGIIALGWLWVPSLFQSFSGSPVSQFETHFPLMLSRARIEALTRQQPVYFAINAGKTQIAVILPNAAQPLVQAPIPPDVHFDEFRSSVAGNPGIFTIIPTDDDLWRAWSFNAQGQPSQSGARLIFDIRGEEHTYTLADEGALLAL